MADRLEIEAAAGAGTALRARLPVLAAQSA